MPNKTIEKDVESAYGSDIISTSTTSMKKEQLSIEEPISNIETWYQWFKYRIHHYMILEVLFFIILILLLINSYKISSQNEETHKMISNIQNQMNRLEKRIDTKHDPEKENSEIQKETKLNENKLIEEIVKLEEKDVELVEKIERVLEEKSKPLIEITTIQPLSAEPSRPISFEQHENSTNSSLYVFNAASILIGASIDYEHSSRIVTYENGFLGKVEAFFGTVNGEYVLLERDELPVNKAWCTDDNEPTLTVNLANYIIPTAVSYQHTKWNGTIPDGAPKVYNLVACLDSECQKSIKLVSNCEYTASENKQEQRCQIPTISNLPPINKVQFHFYKNHGNTTKTCAHLVRVYGEKSSYQPEYYEKETVNSKKKDCKLQEEKEELEKGNNETCSQLAWMYHNVPLLYNIRTEKNCVNLYSKNCCSVCPECCIDCEMSLGFYNTLLAIILILGPSIFVCGVYLIICCLQKNC